MDKFAERIAVLAVAEGVLHGKHGAKDRPGWLTLDGSVRPDAAALTVHSVTGDIPYVIGGLPPNSPLSYHVVAHFAGAQGSGDRVELRRCHFDFARQ
jgi:hypothetical protein